MKMRNKERMEMQLFICIKDKTGKFLRHLDWIWGPLGGLERDSFEHVGFQNKNGKTLGLSRPVCGLAGWLKKQLKFAGSAGDA